MKNKFLLLVVGMFLLVVAVEGVSAATLFESNWATATGTDSNAVQDGGTWTDWEFSSSASSYTWWEVKNDGSAPGGRNYLELTRRPSGSTNLLADSSNSMGNPSPLYFRMWFRLNPSWSGIEHLYRVRDSYDNLASNQIYIFSIRNNYNGQMSVGIQVPSATAYMVVGRDIRDNEWHRWEVKAENAGTSYASFECRLDGEDVTSIIRNKNTGTYLTSVNGNLDVSALNYQRWEFYDAGGIDIHFCDITGVKFTDGPDWIGGEIQEENVLVECNWDTGIGTSSTAIRCGYFDISDSRGGMEVIANDGTVPGDRNFLRIHGITNSPMEHEATSFGNPSTLYIRAWVRPWTTSLSHTCSISPDINQPTTGEDVFYSRTQANALSLVAEPYTDDPYRRRNDEYTVGEWYMLEYKITNNPGANDFVEVRIDGIDVTDTYFRASGAISLADDNGALDINELNYINFHTSSTYPEDVIDYAGLKITTGPDWIGGG